MKLVKEYTKQYFDPKTIITSTENENIDLCGCIHKIRKMSDFAFVIIRTGRYLVQCIYNSTNTSFPPDNLKEGDHVEISGKVRHEERSENGIEIDIITIKVLSSPAEQMPISISKKKLNISLDTNLNHRPVILRNPAQRAVFKLQEGIISGFRNFMLNNAFTEIHSPKIVSAGAEGGANIFKLDYMGRSAYLAQSPQFYKQTMVGVFDRVFEIAPVYRAEKHNTSRHLNEYIGLDFEMAYINDMYDVMSVEASMLKAVVTELEANYKPEIQILDVKLPVINEIPSLTFAEVKEILRSCGKASRSYFDLEPEEEQTIGEYAKKELNSDFIFITHYPSSQRPFYAMDDSENPDLALSFDLLFKGMEITTGGQRIHDYNMQIAKMKSRDMNPDNFNSYLMIHKHGMPPHGGLGIGLERLLMKLLDLPNVRMASLFPRDLNRLDP